MIKNDYHEDSENFWSGIYTGIGYICCMATNEELFDTIRELKDSLFRLENRLDGKNTDDEKTLAERIERLTQKLDETNSLLNRLLDEAWRCSNQDIQRLRY